MEAKFEEDPIISCIVKVDYEEQNLYKSDAEHLIWYDGLPLNGGSFNPVEDHLKVSSYQ